MRSNELIPGEPRLSWPYIDSASGPSQIAAMLLDTGALIKLTLPLEGGLRQSMPHSRWWDFGVKHMDDPDRTKYSYAPPRVLVFQGSFGTVALVCCGTTNYRSSLSAGHGEIVPNFAVLGGRSFGYEKINGMRTEAPALAAWARLSAMSFKNETDEKQRVQALEMRLLSPRHR